MTERQKRGTQRGQSLRFEQLEQRQLLAGLVHETDLAYLGAFKLPSGTFGASSFGYGGTALAFNPANNSLFIVGHDWHQAIAEISIPTLSTSSSLSNLSTAGVLQPFVNVTSRVPNYTLEDTVKVGGLQVANGQLIVSLYEYYDGDADAQNSHYKLSSLNLSSASVTGLFKVGNNGGGYVGGYMAEVPDDWQDDFGAPYMTGLSGVAVIARTSAGPGAFGFDPAQLGGTTAPTTSLVYYPYWHGGSHPDDHPLADVDSTNPFYNTSTQIRGLVFPEGSESVLFFGSHGIGTWWYGSNGDYPGLNDPARTSKGEHAYPYVYQVWAYDANDLRDVKNGIKEPWEVQPYDVWNYEPPFAASSGHAGGVAYDPTTGRIFVAQPYGDGERPVIYVYQVGAGTPDTTAPTISSVASGTPTSSGATITWTTNEASDTQVEYGLTTSYGSSTTLNTTDVTSHSAVLSGLAANTLYHYRVKSRDAAGNLAVSADFTFTTASADTTAPSISSVAASGLTASGATIAWTTNEPSDTQVEYGLTTAYGNSTTLNTLLVKTHAVTLGGLTANRVYNYRVRSRDAAGNLAISGNFTFTTAAAPDTTAPTISSVTVSGITSSGATIAWTTSETSDTQVEYGLTTSYGSTTALNSALLTSHSATLTGLTPGRQYNYRVRSRDAAGNLAISGNFTFTTSAADTTAPTISAVASSGISASGATIGWTTNESSDTQVEYGLTTSYGSSTTLNSAMVTSHSATLSGLSASTVYHYRVKSRDAAGNLATSGDYTFTTSAQSAIYSYDNPPPLAASNPSTTVNVSTVSQLISALSSLRNGWTIRLAAGTYNLSGVTDALYVPMGVTDWTIRGATGDRDDVVIRGEGMNGGVRFGIWAGSARGRIADLTIDGVSEHGIIANYGAQGLLVHNVRIVDSGDQFVKSNPDGNGNGNDGGIVQYSVFEYRGTDTDNYTNGVDINAGDAWIVRYNLFRNFLSPAGQGLAGPAVLAWGGSSNTRVEGNTFVNVARGVSLGLIDKSGGTDHSGGLVVNNFFYRDPSLPQDVDVAIFVGDSPNTKVLHNTVIGRGSYPNAVEYRFASTTGLQIRNNLLDGAIQARDGASATVTGNITNASLSWFVNAAAGDLHLVGSAPVIGQATVLADAAVDIDGQSRGGSADVGADEYAGAADTIAPTISAVAAGALTSSGATITWTTNEASDTQVEYGLTTSYGSSTTLNSALVTGHSATLSGLTANSLYHYRVKSRDAAGNLAISSDFTLKTSAADTTPPAITSVASGSVSSSSATITWTTNETSDTQVEYGLTTAYGNSTTLNTSLVTSHSATLSGLTANQLYHYRVKSRDAAGNLATSADFTFSTAAPPDTTAPSIASVSASGITSTGATITWKTNEASDTQVEYGLTTAYGSSTTRNASLVIGHSAALTGLTANRLYHYRVRSRDAAGNLAISGDFTFTTAAAPDTAAPTISAVAASSVTSSGATISWTTNESSDTQVEYGLTTSYGTSTTLNSAMVTSHSAVLAGLAAGRQYNYRVRSRDAAGNLAVSGNFTFTTAAAPDTTAPTISAVAASEITSSGATIAWTTNEASDTQVEYGLTTSYGSSTTLNGAMVTSHIAMLSGLSANRLYHYRVKSRDSAGNLQTSGDFTFTTAAPSAIYSYDNPPPLAASNPSTTTNVSTVSQLISALRNLRNGWTIRLAAGTYNLSGVTDGLYVPVGVTDWTIRGATGDRDDVVIKGGGMNGSVRFGIWTSSARGKVADLTIDGVNEHGIVANYGAHDLLVHNVRIVDSGDQFMKSNPGGSSEGNDRGIVQYSVFEYRTTDNDNYTNGVDIHAADAWIVRYNLFRNILSPAGQGLASPAVLAWNGSSNTRVEGNTFINVARGISLGLIDKAGGTDHSGGLIVNNFFYRPSGLAQAVDVPIMVADSPNTKVFHNTVIGRGSYPNAIEYRFASSTGLQIRNNLLDGAIQARDGASASVSGNVTNASVNWFVNAAAGNLHLLSSAPVIGQASVLVDVSVDIDGQSRGSSADVGADEYAAPAAAMSPEADDNEDAFDGLEDVVTTRYTISAASSTGTSKSGDVGAVAGPLFDEVFALLGASGEKEGSGKSPWLPGKKK